MNVFFTAVWLALSLLFFVEGSLLAFSPQTWRQLIEKIGDCPECLLEKITNGMRIIGVLLIVGRHFFLPANNVVWLAVALVLLVESVFLRVFPSSWLEVVFGLSEENDELLQRTGKTLLLTACGLALVVVWGR